jgi:hypothetical protein
MEHVVEGCPEARTQFKLEFEALAALTRDHLTPRPSLVKHVNLKSRFWGDESQWP